MEHSVLFPGSDGGVVDGSGSGVTVLRALLTRTGRNESKKQVRSNPVDVPIGCTRVSFTFVPTLTLTSLQSHRPLPAQIFSILTAVDLSEQQIQIQAEILRYFL